MKKCGIYKITNKVNNKVYIGQSVDISRRWSEEKSRSRQEDLLEHSALLSALNKYGIDNFIFEIIEECSEEDLNQREAYWIDFYDSVTPKGYNILQMSNQVVTKQNKCAICGCAIDKQSKFCVPCSHIAQRKVERPDAEQLKQEIITLKGFEAVGRKYGVSGNTIKKWCKSYGLPTYVKDYKENKKTPTYPIRKVAQINKDTEEIIKIWDNCAEAARGVGGNNSHITEVCNGIHKTAYGYKWKYID